MKSCSLTRVASLAAVALLAGCGPRSAKPPLFVVFFTPNATDLDEPARTVVADAAKAAATAPDRDLIVHGYAAPAQGKSAASDLLLSQRRSLVVTNALVSGGVKQSRIHQIARGSVGGDPGIESRRVGIEFED